MSDPFAALLAKQAPASETSEEDSDPFNSLLKKGKPTAAPVAPAAKAGEIPTGSPYAAPPKAEQDPSTLGKLVRGKGALETAADVGDIVVGGFPAMLLGTLGEVTQRASSLVDGRGYREGAKAGAQFSQAMGEKFGRPIFDNLVASGLLDPKSRSVPMQAMDKIGGWLENAATIVEHDSGGAISKEDYLAGVNGFMAAMGVKGTSTLVKGGVKVPFTNFGLKGLDERIARSKQSTWDRALERFDAEEQLARAREAEGLAARSTTPVADAAKARLLKPEEPAAGGRTREQARKDAKVAFSTPEAGEQAGLIDRQAAYREELAAQEAAVRDRFPPSGERTGSRDAVDLSLEGKETPTTYGGNQPFHTADTTAALKRGVVADTPIQTEGRLAPVAATPLDSGLLKVKENRLFDMTMEERLAVKNSTKITDPKVITAAAVGATGLGLAMAYEPSAEEAAMAIGAGVLLRRGGVGESMRELVARPDATPLGAMLESSAYTTSTLEKLADASPGAFKFKKTAVEQLLKREGVTKHERDLMTAALAQAPGETITAKQLMVGLRVAAQDFELTPERVGNFADYGLERIDRKLDEGLGAENLPPFEELEARGNTVYGPDGDIIDELRPGQSLRSWYDTINAQTAPEETITRIYRSPLELGSNNHFDDANYFAHTRSFVEDGVRHVVELQSDLAQKALSKLAPEARQQLTLRAERLKKEIQGLEAKRHAEHAKLGEKLSELQKKGLDATSNEWREEGRYYREQLRELDGQENDFRVEQAEVQAKLTEAASAEARAPVAPMLKDWHKRLIREELADAARNLESSVRFATADTVAKVEGWPDGRAATEQRLRDLEAERAAAMRGELGGSGLRPDVALSRIEQLIEHEKSILEGMAPGRNLRSEHQGIYDRYSRDVEKFLRQLGAQPITDSAGHTWLEVPLGEQQKVLPGGGARTQIGGVDPALLKGAAAVGGTAALAAWLSNDKDKVKHAAMAGALTGLGLLAKSRVPAIGTMVKQTTAGIQQLVGNLSTDSAVTAPLLRRLTEHARAELKGIHDAGRVVAPFLEIASQLPASVQKELNVALMNGSTTGILAAVGKAATPGLLKEWNKVQAQLKAFGTELQSVGLLKELRPDYFPRIVKDLPGLLNAIGKEYAVPLQRALDEATKRAGHPLDEADRAAIINRFIEKNLRGQSGQGKASFFKRRTIDNVSVDLEPFYVEPLQALPLYIGSVVRATEKARFFGRDAVKDPTTGKLDLTASIGNVVAREIDAGNLTPENFTRLTEILRTRFGTAYSAPARPLQTLGQLTNIALLGNVFSGMMNLADIGTIAAQHGVVPLAAAVAAKLGKRQKISAADVGMANQIMEEFVYGTREPVKVKVPFTERTVQLSMAKALEKTFKFSGFTAFDRVMKDVALNAAFEKYTRLARTKAGEARIKRQYDSYFTSDMPQLLADLRAGAKSKLTVELAFRELSDAQPVTKIEMPQFYLDHPNLRFGFALKSFMIKQINLVKKRGVDEIARGNRKEGVGFLMRYALMAGAAGATMDWVVKSLLGRDTETDWKMIPLNALKNLGLSEYVIDKARQGKGKEAILAATLPPVDPILNIITADPEAVRYIPIVGRLAYDRFMDGAEKANAAKKLAEKKRKREEERTPSERRELERRALERRQRLLQEN